MGTRAWIADHGGILIKVYRYGISTAAIEGMATYLNPKNRVAALLRHRSHLRADWRLALMGELGSTGDIDRLHRLQHDGAAMS